MGVVISRWHQRRTAPGKSINRIHNSKHGGGHILVATRADSAGYLLRER